MSPMEETAAWKAIARYHVPEFRLKHFSRN